MRNIILFISDQQRADCVPGALPKCVHAPNLAWISSHGVTFERAYCTSPLCTPARGSILTGKLPSETGIVANYGALPLAFPEGLMTAGDYLKKAGYETAYGGKWHLPTGSARPGFDHVLGRLSRYDTDSPAEDQAINQARQWGEKLGDTYTSYLRNEDEKKAGFHGRSTKLPLSAFPSTQMALLSAEWLRNKERQNAPFFLTFSCIEPHPLGMRYDVAPAPFDGMYHADQFELPYTLRERGVGDLLRGRNFAGLKATDGIEDQVIRKKIAQYMGAVSYVDFLLGLLMEALASNDILKNTLLIFTSDHGEMLGHHRMLKKGPVMYEDIINVPLIVSDCGGAVESRNSNAIVSHIDILPTCLDVAGVSPSSELPGKSLMPLINEETPSIRKSVSVEYHSCIWGDTPTPLRAYIEQDWKMVIDREEVVAVYNLQQDPEEEHNLLLQREDEVDRLKNELHALLQNSADHWPEIALPSVSATSVDGDWDRIRHADSL